MDTGVLMGGLVYFNTSDFNVAEMIPGRGFSLFHKLSSFFCPIFFLFITTLIMEQNQCAFFKKTLLL